MRNGKVPASFRDPGGFLFEQDGALYRQVNLRCKENYANLIDSGLYDTLVKEGLLIPHDDASGVRPLSDEAFKVIRPERIPFISYSYEWCFDQLKDAALTTLEIQKKAMESGMSLKDCSAYNIQFRRGRPVFIDTLSFELYREGRPWAAYRQFCQHFLAPLALMSYRDDRLGRLLQAYLDGIPLDLAASLLPAASRFRSATLLHIHLHAGCQRRFAGRAVATDSGGMGRNALSGLLNNLEGAVLSLRHHRKAAYWPDYYGTSSYSSEAMGHKKKIVGKFLERIMPGDVWDLGANTGEFSVIPAGMGIRTVSFDMDPDSVQINYLRNVKAGNMDILPLVMDLANPSPGIGWMHSERASLSERGPADTALALALVHHLAIASNIPLESIAVFLSGVCRNLIIEFVPKEDSQTQRLLSSRTDIFDRYTEQAFEESFGRLFAIEESSRIPASGRTIYLMRRR